MRCRIGSLYICVKDMDRAIDFYERFFEQPVSERGDIYSVFDISGFRFGLFAYLTMNEPHSYGSNILPSVSVDSLEVLMHKTADKEICFPLTHIGNNWVAEFADTEGNHIEITAPYNNEVIS